ncbi:MAG: hypothetical protein FJW39_05650 [Acidobacteria bacterium]|nr:hypothetical protein [Acidobacteriota bacterium]
MYQERDKWFRLVVLVLSSGSVFSAMSSVDPMTKLIAPVLATGGSFWLLLSHYASLSKHASDLSAGWGAIARDMEALWNNLEAPDAEAMYHRLNDGAGTLSKSGTKFPRIEKRLIRCLDHSAALLTSRYASVMRDRTAPTSAALAEKRSV